MGFVLVELEVWEWLKRQTEMTGPSEKHSVL